MSDDLQRYRPEYPGFMMPDPDGVWVDRRQVADRIEALIADRDALRKRVEAADQLAELVAELLESESDHQTEWDITAKQCLAAYRAEITGGKADDHTD